MSKDSFEASENQPSGGCLCQAFGGRGEVPHRRLVSTLVQGCAHPLQGVEGDGTSASPGPVGQGREAYGVLLASASSQPARGRRRCQRA